MELTATSGWMFCFPSLTEFEFDAEIEIDPMNKEEDCLGDVVVKKQERILIKSRLSFFKKDTTDGPLLPNHHSQTSLGWTTFNCLSLNKYNHGLIRK